MRELDTFELALRRAICELDSDPDQSSITELERLGLGGHAVVFRGYVHRWDPTVRERVRWMVIKAPLPRTGEDGVFRIDNAGLETEAKHREEIGWLPGLAAVPIPLKLPARSVERFIPDEDRRWFDLRGDLKILIFARPDERMVHVGPAALIDIDVVVRATNTARGLVNWCEVARALATALLALHGKGWAHRDLKLENVVAQVEGEFLRSIEIIDFGTAIRLDGFMPPFAGTPEYWRPERIRAAALNEPAVAMPQDDDVYALGALLARLLLGGVAPAVVDIPGLSEEQASVVAQAAEYEHQVRERLRRPDLLTKGLRDELAEAFGVTELGLSRSQN
jgi:hypothetical protein